MILSDSRRLTTEIFSSDAVAFSVDGDDFVHATLLYDEAHSTPVPRDEELGGALLGLLACCLNPELLPHNQLVVDLVREARNNLSTVLERADAQRGAAIAGLSAIREELGDVT